MIVGLTGYPNVGKSSTINALYGKKKTAVAPTPGKTKHFQTLHVRPGLTLCDCPGLVLPRFAANKAEMVAAGVLPIDRLTDTRPPVHVVAQRVGRTQLEAVYGLRLPAPAMHEPPRRYVAEGCEGCLRYQWSFPLHHIDDTNTYRNTGRQLQWNCFEAWQWHAAGWSPTASPTRPVPLGRFSATTRRGGWCG